MAWNPSPEVAVARDAARKLGSPMCVVIWITHDERIGMASYGKTMELCRHAGSLGNHLLKAATTWGEDEEAGGEVCERARGG